jgi:hypothetical protein
MGVSPRSKFVVFRLAPITATKTLKKHFQRIHLSLSSRPRTTISLEKTPVKYALLALLFLGLGYTLGLFISPSDVGLSNIQTTATNLKQQLIGPAETDNIKVEVAVPAPTYPEGSYLTESDLLSIPGTIKPLGFRVGPPITLSAANDLIDELKDLLPATKARYISGNNKQLVIILAGQYADSDLATKDLRTLQPMMKERLEIIHLPACVIENKADDEGYICPPPPPPEAPAATPTG